MANGLAWCSFLDDLPRLWKENYAPTNADIVHSRARTVGMTETQFKVSGHILRLIDVGGQKSERRKWINFFQDVTSILFLVSLSGYDECLIEDRDAVRQSLCFTKHLSTHQFHLRIKCKTQCKYGTGFATLSGLQRRLL